MDAAHESSEHAMEAGTTTAEETLEQLREDVVRIARNFDNQPPAVMFAETLRVRNLAVRALEQTRRPAQQADLYLVAAQCAGLACGACMDLSLWDAAMEFARAGYTYAEVIDHDGARAYSRGMQAQIAYWTGRTREALQYALAAAELAPAGIAQVRAQSILARAWSHRGDVAEVHAAIAAAEEGRDTDGDDDLHDTIGGEFGFSAIRQARCGGTAFLRVGEAEHAARHTRHALELVAAGPQGPWSSVEAEARSDLAASQLLIGQLDAVVDSLAPIWDMPVAWRRNGLSGRVDHLRTLLSAPRWRGSAAARGLADQAEEFIAARAAALPGERLALPHA
ncbi:MAG: XRE family transcriptional regulator [Sporichthyaceae bacterium]|nr:XRE family transcriptional regulator [Sporichthyaceae bacterium]